MSYADVLSRIFRVGIVIKGLFAVLDLTAATVAAILGTSDLVRIVTALSRGELRHDPDDLLASAFLRLAQDFSPDMQAFALTYLLVHGLINAVVAVGLWRGSPWSHPAAIIGMTGFVLYQLYRLTLAFSPWLAVVTVFDVMLILLVLHDYRLSVRHHARSKRR